MAAIIARAACIVLLLALAVPAEAQVTLRRKPPPRVAPEGVGPAQAAIWPYPLPDPASWWEDDRPRPPEAANPLGDRKLRSRERLTPVDSGVEPNLYRLWGLQPLQTQVLRGDEMILEVWARPARSVRQSVIRITVRRDGETFVQARAGLACCEAGIARRVGFDAELPRDADAAFLKLRDDPLWEAPRDVRVAEAGAADVLCIDGTAWDLTLMVPGRARSVRRACEPAEIGQAADVLEAVLAAARGHEPRIDMLLPPAGEIPAARRAYESLLASGGALKPAPHGRAQPPSFTPEPQSGPAEPAP